MSIALENTLDDLARLNRVFSPGEVAVPADTELTPSELEQILVQDTRFVKLSVSGSGEPEFVPRLCLCKWFVWLNARLALAGVFRLSEASLLRCVCSLRQEGYWAKVPDQFIEIPAQLGLISASPNPSQFVFPLAWVISKTDRTLIGRCIGLMQIMVDSRIRREYLDKLKVDRILESFPDRVGFVIKEREGLLGDKRRTLEEIGRDLGVTRERVRQIEKRFWDSLSGKTRAGRRSNWPEQMIGLCAACFMESGGRLLIDRDSATAKAMKIVCRGVGIPFSLSPKHLIVGSSAKYETLVTTSRETDETQIRQELLNECGLHMAYEDLALLAHDFALERLSKLTKTERVIAALRYIGRPSHYLEVTEVYNSLWPADKSTPRSIHAVLSRQEHGVVWVGVRGTFALREWGYERPSKGLFESVAEIVSRKYAETKRPVPFDVVKAEISRYRQIVNPTSLYFAAFLNPRLRLVHRDLLLPKEVQANTGEEDYSREEWLDRALSEFEKRISRRGG